MYIKEKMLSEQRESEIKWNTRRKRTCIQRLGMTIEAAKELHTHELF